VVGDDVESGAAAKTGLLTTFDQSVPSTKVSTYSVSYGVTIIIIVIILNGQFTTHS